MTNSLRVIYRGLTFVLFLSFGVSCSNDEDAPPDFVGNYKGFWNDNLYTNFPISIKLTTATSGILYYSPTQSSCCGGAHDGTISFTLDGKNVTAFRYDQKLASFMGGPCDGVYEGSGTVDTSNKISFTIVFTGNDCEGPHTNGRLTFTKV